MQECADAVLMTPPHDFAFNDQTGVDNAFQTRAVGDAAAQRGRALAEYAAMVSRLEGEGVQVVTLPPRRPHARPTPDAVFLNNWLRLDARGTVWTFAMATANRRRERRPRLAEKVLWRAGFEVRRSVHIGAWMARRRVVEGTGALLFDAPRRLIFAALSRRCDAAALARYAAACRHRLVAFHTRGPDGQPVYHTNVMLALGDGVAVVCAEAIADGRERQRVTGELARHRRVITIDAAQMGAFCGNMLQLQDNAGGRLFVMSRRAHEALDAAQRRALSDFGRLVAVDLTTLETVGGGSARCMLAEIFLPRRRPPRP